MGDHIQQLANIRDSWRAGNFIDDKECEFVSQHFILPNFLSHFAAVTDRLICFRDQRLTADFTYGDLLHIWSTDYANPEVRSELERLLQQLIAEEEWGLSQYHPWRCIDRWILMQVISGRLQNPTAAPAEHCWRLLLEVFSERNEKFKAAFHTWMNSGSGWLNQALVGLLNRLIVMEDCAQIGETIRATLGQVPPPFMQQTGALAVRRGDNFEELRRSSISKNRLQMPDPANDGWLRKVASKLMIARNAHSNFAWDADNQTKLRLLLAWIKEREIEQEHPAPLEPLHKLASLKTPVMISGGDAPRTAAAPISLSEVLSAWNALLLLVRTRWRRQGYRDDWGDRDRVLEDLFCHPLMCDFSFEDWRDSMDFVT